MMKKVAFVLILQITLPYTVLFGYDRKWKKQGNCPQSF